MIAGNYIQQKAIRHGGWLFAVGGPSYLMNPRGDMPNTAHNESAGPNDVWPALPEAAWSDTRATLHLWVQVVGKIRMELTPAINQCWNVTLYPTARGVTTMPMWHGTRCVQIDFDFLDHLLVIETADGGRRAIPLKPMSVAEFYRQVMAALDSLGVPVHIWPMPVEVAQPIPFDKDQTHRAYDAEYAQRFWRVLLQTTRVFY